MFFFIKLVIKKRFAIFFIKIAKKRCETFFSINLIIKKRFATFFVKIVKKNVVKCFFL
jgi:hypothetical protein